MIKADAMKLKDASRYRYQYIKDLTIDEEAFSITIHGRLSVNDQEKSEYYKTDLAGNKKQGRVLMMIMSKNGWKDGCPY